MSFGFLPSSFQSVVAFNLCFHSTSESNWHPTGRYYPPHHRSRSCSHSPPCLPPNFDPLPLSRPFSFAKSAADLFDRRRRLDFRLFHSSWWASPCFLSCCCSCSSYSWWSLRLRRRIGCSDWCFWRQAEKATMGVHAYEAVSPSCSDFVSANLW